jgi:hypothetical protein
MADFKKSFNKGLDAAEHSKKNKMEIHAVFEDLKNQILEATEGRVVIFLDEGFKASGNIFGGGANNLAKALSAGIRKAYSVCCSLADDKSSKETLAEYVMGVAGYPFELHFNNQEFVCRDRQALEVALETLLSNPVVGEKIQRVMAL